MEDQVLCGTEGKHPNNFYRLYLAFVISGTFVSIFSAHNFNLYSYGDTEMLKEISVSCSSGYFRCSTYRSSLPSDNIHKADIILLYTNSGLLLIRLYNTF